MKTHSSECAKNEPNVPKRIHTVMPQLCLKCLTADIGEGVSSMGSA